jgi:hypothetical protein
MVTRAGRAQTCITKAGRAPLRPVEGQSLRKCSRAAGDRRRPVSPSHFEPARTKAADASTLSPHPTPGTTPRMFGPLLALLPLLGASLAIPRNITFHQNVAVRSSQGLYGPIATNAPQSSLAGGTVQCTSPPVSSFFSGMKPPVCLLGTYIRSRCAHTFTVPDKLVVGPICGHSWHWVCPLIRAGRHLELSMSQYRSRALPVRVLSRQLRRPLRRLDQA